MNTDPIFKIPILIQDSTGILTQALQRELNSFHWTDSFSFQILECTESDVLSQMVPWIENVQPFILLAPERNVSRWIFQAYRYVGQNIILSSISNKHSVLEEFYQADGSKRFQNLLRLDACALQWHLCDPDKLLEMEENNARILRLGELKQQIIKSEPILRDANCIILDVSALKKSEFPAKDEQHQSGLTSEEMAQLMRFAGFSQKAACIGIGGYENKEILDAQSINVLAQAIYYAADGIKNRKNELQIQTPDITRFHIQTEEEVDDPFLFVKGNQSGCWWITIPDLTLPDNLSSHKYYACNQDDYESALEGDHSETLIKARLWFDHLQEISRI